MAEHKWAAILHAIADGKEVECSIAMKNPQWNGAFRDLSNVLVVSVDVWVK